MKHSTHQFTLGALNAEARLPIRGMCGARIDIRGTFVLSITVEASMNGTDWVPIATVPSGAITASAAGSSVISTVNNFIAADLAGFTELRLRCSAYTSGSATVVISVTEESQIDQAGLMGSPAVVLGGSSSVIGQVFNADNVFFNESVANLAISGVFTGTSRDVGVAAGSQHRYAAFNAFALADQAGTLRIECSNDNVNWRRMSADVAVAANTPVILTVPVMTRYHRVVYTNGGVAQTLFICNASYTVA